MKIKIKERGFTMVELLVVIAIIGILASIALISYNSVQNKAKDKAIISEMTQLRTQGQVFYDDNTNAYTGFCLDAGTTKISGSITDHVSFHKLLEGGKITWPDGTFATREVDKTFTWYRENNPLMDEVHVNGEASGMNRRGEAYKASIISTIIWKRACRLRGVCVPVQGLKLVERRDHSDVLVDFGDGECDLTVTITKNGESKVIEKEC